MISEKEFKHVAGGRLCQKSGQVDKEDMNDSSKSSQRHLGSYGRNQKSDCENRIASVFDERYDMDSCSCGNSGGCGKDWW